MEMAFLSLIIVSIGMTILFCQVTIMYTKTSQKLRTQKWKTFKLEMENETLKFEVDILRMSAGDKPKYE